jgi:Zn finger protein HypA/HybF involved in hydrogenase expression
MSRKFTREQIIEKFNQIHNFKYNYDKVEYSGDGNKIIITCLIHGDFLQTPASHGRAKQGCPKCGVIKRVKERRYTQEEFRDIVNKNFNYNIDTSISDYKGAHSYINAKCIKHNIVFNTQATTLIRKHNSCPACHKENFHNTLKNKHAPLFLNKCIKIHGDVYDYSLVEYNGSNIPVKIICKNHGVFEQKPSNHLSGCGCPVCRLSRGEQKIGQFLKINNIKFEYQYRVRVDGSYHYYDFFIPDQNLIIEFNGLQHYKSIEWFGGDNMLNYIKKRDLIKENFCKINNIRLLKIHYKDKNKIDQILQKEIIK